MTGSEALTDAAVGCTDLLLRWVTLRFFDTNTTVNMKCLEFLSALFKLLLTVESYRMSDYEANAFLPYLVNKVTCSVCMCVRIVYCHGLGLHNIGVRFFHFTCVDCLL